LLRISAKPTVNACSQKQLSCAQDSTKCGLCLTAIYPAWASAVLHEARNLHVRQ
jgi:hypothetical protein